MLSNTANISQHFNRVACDVIQACTDLYESEEQARKFAYKVKNYLAFVHAIKVQSLLEVQLCSF